MNDTVAVANWVSSLEGTSLAHVKAIFQEYYSERFPIAKETFATTQKGTTLGFHLHLLPASIDHEAHSIEFACFAFLLFCCRELSHES